MSPQPLSSAKIKPPPQVWFWPGAFAYVHRDIKLWVGEILATWNHVEVAVDSLASVAMHANAVAVSEIMSGIQNFRLRYGVIERAMREAMSEEHFRLYQQVSTIVIRVGKARNDLAHHLWGFIDERPEWLLLLNPKHLKREWAERIALVSRGVGPYDQVKVASPVDHAHFMYWTVEEIEGICREAYLAENLVGLLELVVRPDALGTADREPGDTALDLLLARLPGEAGPDWDSPAMQPFRLPAEVPGGPTHRLRKPEAPT